MNQQIKKWIKISTHIVVWGVIMLLPYLVSFYLDRQIGWRDAYFRWVLNTLANCSFFYFYYLFYNPLYLKKGKYSIYFVGALLFILLSSLLRTGVYHYVDMNYEGTFFNTKYWSKFLGVGIFQAALWLLALLFSFIASVFRAFELIQEKEKQEIKSELEILRYKINPHFLFNTLNNIYTLVYKKADNAPQAVMKLSQIMRYMLNSENENIVLLSQEVEYLQNFIALQKLRLRNEHRVSFEINGELDGKYIESMLLIPFVENAFKHGISSQPNSNLCFKLDVSDTKITFYSENTIPDTIVNKDATNGIGLETLKKRLNLLYPKQHTLSIQHTKQKYIAELNLNIQCK